MLRQTSKLIIILSLIFFSNQVFSANLYFELEEGKIIKVGDNFTVKVMVDPENELINAIESNIIFPGNSLSLKTVDDSKSIINLWVDKPQKSSAVFSKNLVESFFLSGIIPGGFDGILTPYAHIKPDGEIISLVFLAKKEGYYSIKFEDPIILENDGLGTPIQTSHKNISFEIKQGGFLTPNESEEKAKDLTPPEDFEITISSDPNIFDGQYFIIFNTHDKESGMYYYEVKEGSKDFKIAESPYLLKNQNPNDTIVVKAIDNAGNIRKIHLNKIDETKIIISRLLIITLFVLVVAGVLIKNHKAYGMFRKK